MTTILREAGGLPETRVKPAEEGAGTHINSQHVVLEGLPQLLHNLRLRVGTGRDRALHSDGSLGVVNAQVLQAGHRERKRNFLFSKGRINPRGSQTRLGGEGGEKTGFPDQIPWYGIPAILPQTFAGT